MNWLHSLQAFTDSLPGTIQFLGVLLAGAVPFVEGYGAALIGVVAGVNPWIAIPVAIIGNIAVMVPIVLLFERLRAGVLNRRAAQGKPVLGSSRRQEKIHRAFNRYGVPGASLLLTFVIPTQVTASALVSFGAHRGSVILWQSIGITLYALVVGGFMAGSLATSTTL